MPNPEADIKLDRLLADARQLDKDYDDALERHSRSVDSNLLFAGIAVNLFDLPEEITSPSLNLFLKRWEQTPEYEALRTRFEGLHDRVKAFLRTTSERTKSNRWPGNSRKLMVKLRPISEAVRTDTKIRRLIVALEDLDLRELVYNEDLPRRQVRKPRKVTSGTKRLVSTAAGLPTRNARPDQEAWALVSIFITVAVSFAVGLGISTPLGWIWGSAVAIVLGIAITAIVAVARPLWVGALTRRMQR